MSNLPLSQNKTSDDNVNNFFYAYYNKSAQVTGERYDAVLAFFLGRTKGDKIAAEALTASVMVIAQSKGYDPISIIEDFKKFTDNTSFKAALLALLNSDRRPTSKLGYASTPVPDPYVSRNVHS